MSCILLRIAAPANIPDIKHASRTLGADAALRIKKILKNKKTIPYVSYLIQINIFGRPCQVSEAISSITKIKYFSGVPRLARNGLINFVTTR